MNPNKAARIAGVLYLIMVPLGFFGMYGHSDLIVPGDAVTTANNIMASESLFRLSMMSALIVHVVNILLVHRFVYIAIPRTASKSVDQWLVAHHEGQEKDTQDRKPLCRGPISLQYMLGANVPSWGSNMKYWNWRT